MTTSNINKIMRSNLSIKPWILSKNTSEIVNSYIQKFYKQTPKIASVKNDLLLASKVAASKPENKAPIRSLKTRERARACNTSTPETVAVETTTTKATTPSTRLKGCAQASAPTAHASGGDQLLGAVINNTNKRGALANLAANRKLLKSPNYKIYGSRRFGSSASSSSASIIRRYESHRRHRVNTGVDFNFLMRSMGTYTAAKLSNVGLNNAVLKYVTPVRNQHMAAHSANNPTVLEVSSAIQRDLMIIDGAIKNRISLGRSRVNRERMSLLAEDKPRGDPMKGWHHPPSPDLFFSRTDEQGVAFAELAEQNRRLRASNKLKQLSYMRPGLWPVAPLGKNQQQNAIAKKQSTSVARSAHARTSHAATSRHLPPFKKSNSMPYPSKGKEEPTFKTKESPQPNIISNMKNNAENATSPSLLVTPASKPSPPPNVAVPVEAPVQPAKPTNNAGTTTTTATSILVAAALAASQGPHNYGRFSRSTFNQNRKY